MPIYEYECTSCGDKTEILQSINAEPLTYCSACGQDSLKKVIAPTSFILKGSGWYVTDYPSEDRKKAMERPIKELKKRKPRLKKLLRKPLRKLLKKLLKRVSLLNQRQLRISHFCEKPLL
jgi:putative FmdB family regulatory protein